MLFRSKAPVKKHQRGNQGSPSKQTAKKVPKVQQKAQEKHAAKKQKIDQQEPVEEHTKRQLGKQAVKKQPVRQAKLKNM